MKVVIALLFIVSSSGCSLFSSGKRGGLGNGGSAAATNGTVSIRDFNQLLDSVSVATGVPITDAGLSSFYGQARSRLSLDGNVSSVSPSILLTMTGVAGMACNRMLQMEKALPKESRLVYGMVDFSKDQSILTPQVRSDLFAASAMRFWRRPPTANEIAILSNLIDETNAGQSVSSNQLMNSLLVHCTSMLSSLEFIQG